LALDEEIERLKTVLGEKRQKKLEKGKAAKEGSNGAPLTTPLAIAAAVAVAAAVGMVALMNSGAQAG
jgi:hypothetical protein